MSLKSLEKKLLTHKERGLIRKRVPITHRQKVLSRVNDQLYINFCSNNYLGLASHPAIKKAMIAGVKRYGVGSGASPLLSGYYAAQQQLEEEFADFMRLERAVIFNSGYMANIGAITSLIGRTDNVILDKFCHASIIDAISLARAKFTRYQHNNISHLKKLMLEKDIAAIVTESVFSMEGDITPVAQILLQAKQMNAHLFIDDSHGFGVIGKHGYGAMEKFNISKKDPVCITFSLAKTLGCIGGIVAGNRITMAAVLQFARTNHYTTALPPATFLALQESLKLIKSEHWRHDYLNELVDYFVQEAIKRGIPLISYDKTAIKCIPIGNNQQAKNIQEALFNKGFWVACVRPPTISVGGARLRVSLSCEHTKEQVLLLLAHLEELLC